jgi:predicted O-methyltransferase YrrM
MEQQLLLRHGDTLRRTWLGTALLDRRMRACGFRTMAATPEEGTPTPSAVRMNRLLEATGGGRRYLEIGVQHGFTLDAVAAETVVGVDPAHRVNIARMPAHNELVTAPADEFFAGLALSGSRARYDLVFVDGLHHFLQAYRDVLNSVRILDRQGLVVVDDTVPSTEFAAIPDRSEAKRLHQERGIVPWEWMGDVYKAVVAVTRFHPELRVATILEDGVRPQTVLWLKSDHSPRSLASAAPEDIATVGRMTFAEVFQDGMPPEFRPMTLADAILGFREDVGLIGVAG